MKIELTTDQQQQLDSANDRPVNVRDPRTHAEYVLLPTDEYEQMLEIVEDDLEQRALRRVAAKTLSKRLADDQV